MYKRQQDVLEALHGERLAEVQRAEGDPHEDDAQQHHHVGHAGGHKSLDGCLARRNAFDLLLLRIITRIPEADERVGAEAHEFPTEEEQQQVIGHHQQQHGAAEETHIAEEARQQRLLGHVVLRLALVLAQAVAPVVVADAVDEDHRRRQ